MDWNNYPYNIPTDVSDFCSRFETASSGVRFTDKSYNSNERNNITQQFIEQINLYGQEITYIVNNYSLTAHDYIYGEDNTTAYSDPVNIIGFIEYNSDSMLLTRFGIQSDADCTLFVTISGFCNIFGPDAEPKSGDIIQLTEYGSDRRGGRVGPMFKITERDDEQLDKINPLMGHYIWMLKCHRYDYSYENNVKPEALLDGVFDNKLQGILPGGTQTPSPSAKAYPQNVEDEAKKKFDYSKYGNKSSVYGDYE